MDVVKSEKKSTLQCLQIMLEENFVKDLTGKLNQSRNPKRTKQAGSGNIKLY